MSIETEDLLARFLRYVQIDTRSDPHGNSTPSTPGQWDLLHLLDRELREIGAAEVETLPEGYVLATIPATAGHEGAPCIAWFAHVDTSPNLPGAAKPVVHRAWDGAKITLPDAPELSIDVETTPHLSACIGHDIITASGATLLGADDKAGVAVIVAVARHLLAHPGIPHGKIRLCFNPDEEIAGGMQKLDLAKLGADFGYTLDGEAPGEINSETFSADAAVLEIQGVSAHPGWAKGVMVNATRLAARFLASLPMDASPERTAGNQGFIHPFECTGSADRVVVRMILRDFELAGLSALRDRVRHIVTEIQTDEPRARLSLSFTEQYRNMRYWLEKDMGPVDKACEAMRRVGLAPAFIAIRGGTDGSNLTARGLPTPNLFCGMHEVHSQREWVSLQDMVKSAEMLVHLAQVWAQSSK